jgi:hypothetical protein
MIVLKRTIFIFGGSYGSFYNLVSFGEVCLLDFGSEEIYEILKLKSQQLVKENPTLKIQKETILFINEGIQDEEEIYSEMKIDQIPLGAGPPPPPNLLTRPLSMKKIKTKKFHCTAIPKSEIPNSIFSVKKISQNSKLLKLNEDEICERFRIQSLNSTSTFKLDPSVHETISLISSKRSHSLAIQIKALKLSIDETIKLILDSDLNVKFLNITQKD